MILEYKISKKSEKRDRKRVNKLENFIAKWMECCPNRHIYPNNIVQDMEYRRKNSNFAKYLDNRSNPERIRWQVKKSFSNSDINCKLVVE